MKTRNSRINFIDFNALEKVIDGALTKAFRNMRTNLFDEHVTEVKIFDPVDYDKSCPKLLLEETEVRMNRSYRADHNKINLLGEIISDPKFKKTATSGKSTKKES